MSSSVSVIEHDHVSVVVPSVDEAIAWYATHLGFDLIDRWVDETAGMEWAHMSAANARIELVLLPPATVANPPHIGFHHLALVVEDCVSATEALRNVGVTIVTGPTLFERHNTDWAFIADHVGNVIELISYRGARTWPKSSAPLRRRPGASRSTDDDGPTPSGATTAAVPCE